MSLWNGISSSELFIVKVYWPKHDDVGKILKVECTPVLGDSRYSPIFAVSSPVSPGT